MHILSLAPWAELVSGPLRRDRGVSDRIDQLSTDLHHQSPPCADSGVPLPLLGAVRCDRTHPGGRRCSEQRGQARAQQQLSGWEG